MRHGIALRLLGIVIMLLSAASAVTVAGQSSPPATPGGSGVDIVANGLTNPRGFVWRQDGTLNLALAGSGGSTQVGSTPFVGGETSSIVTVSDGCTETLAEGFPSVYWEGRGWVWGVMDIAVLDGELYALHGGGQQGWRSEETPNGVYRVADDGSWEQVADLASWFMENPPDVVPDDFDPNGSPFDMEAGEDRLWITEANGGRLVTVTADGEIELAADLSEQELTPTGVAPDGEGGAFVAFLGIIPYQDGTSKVVHVAADGTMADHWTGLTAVNDLALGPDGVLYAAEMATGNTDEAPFLTPNSGRIVRQTGPDSLEPVAADIPYPVMLGFDADQALYVTGPAFSLDNRGAGQGWLAGIDLSEAPVSLAGISDAPPTCEAT